MPHYIGGDNARSIEFQSEIRICSTGQSTMATEFN